jgi:hypothetical protein
MQYIPELGNCNMKAVIKMVFALVYYPNIDTISINQLRRKYDPQVDLIAPHITLMFPLSESIGEKDLIIILIKF